ncbi:hypothetical protein CY34DRAFT_809251 [Suillus luteus UH-Slu-Lm8-n1]|uniref:Uncharacterized protein n=1 Tax=Suillus luteus UH-Slu-Lm8-n1 TaxID=930992 RepID=A0A0D0AKA2_9AGAM|nr:hypothetical protein CY34DRAFT_809251 [Suillus luteus UH-Slu-Lm8-n1]
MTSVLIKLLLVNQQDSAHFRSPRGVIQSSIFDFFHFPRQPRRRAMHTNIIRGDQGPELPHYVDSPVSCAVHHSDKCPTG